MVYKGNISLIMIFILIIGSIIGLMSTTMLQSMIGETSLLKETYQSYYNAKAGIELGNLAVARHDYGYSDQLSGGSAIIVNNLLREQGDQNSSLDLSITSRIAGASGNNTVTIGTQGEIAFCDQSHAITLIPGGSWIMPLYVDQRNLHDTHTSSSEYYSTMINSDFNIGITTPSQSDVSKQISYSIILGGGTQRIYDAQDSDKQQTLSAKGTLSSMMDNNTIQKFFVPSSTTIGGYTPETSLLSLLSSPQNFSTSGGYFNYFIITNTSNSDTQICIQLSSRPGGYTTDTSLITSIGRYKDTSLGLQSTIREGLSQFILANQADAGLSKDILNNNLSVE